MPRASKAPSTLNAASARAGQARSRIFSSATPRNSPAIQQPSVTDRVQSVLGAIAHDPLVGDQVAKPETQRCSRVEAQEVTGERVGVPRPELAEYPAGARAWPIVA